MLALTPAFLRQPHVPCRFYSYPNERVGAYNQGIRLGVVFCSDSFDCHYDDVNANPVEEYTPGIALDHRSIRLVLSHELSTAAVQSCCSDFTNLALNSFSLYCFMHFCMLSVETDINPLKLYINTYCFIWISATPQIFSRRYVPNQY